MDKDELKKDYANQILVCEQTIQQNLGVIQYCRGKITLLEKLDAEKIPQPTGDIQP